MEFYELQQQAGGRWNHLGFFRTLKAARDHKEKFNTKTEVYPIRIVERYFNEETKASTHNGLTEDDSYELGGC